jgi:hypothetical protein
MGFQNHVKKHEAFYLGAAAVCSVIVVEMRFGTLAAIGTVAAITLVLRSRRGRRPPPPGSSPVLSIAPVRDLTPRGDFQEAKKHFWPPLLAIFRYRKPPHPQP